MKDERNTRMGPGCFGVGKRLIFMLNTYTKCFMRTVECAALVGGIGVRLEVIEADILILNDKKDIVDGHDDTDL